MVHFDPIWSCSDNLNLFSLFNPLWSYSVLFNPLPSYLVHFDHIQSNPVQCSFVWSILSTLVLFSLIWSTLVLIGPLRSYLVHFFHFGLIQFYSIHFSSIQSIRSTFICLVHSVLFGPLQFYSVHFVHFGLIQSTLVLSNPICLTRKHRVK